MKIEGISVGEIVKQVLYMEKVARREDMLDIENGNRTIGELQGITNVVFMGMGEPLANYENTLSAVKILNDPKGINIGARHITISTVGLVPQILKLAKEKIQIIESQAQEKLNEQITNKYYNNKLGDDKDYCIYTDTDSVFYSAIPLVKNEYPNADLNDDEFMTEKILETAGVVQDYINESYNLFAKKFLNCDEHRFDIKQEVVARSAFWVTKKRYG